MRKKTTVYLDPALIRAMKVVAATTGRHEDEVLEDALRRYLQTLAQDSARGALRQLLDDLAQEPGPTDVEALELAYGELTASRTAGPHAKGLPGTS